MRSVWQQDSLDSCEPGNPQRDALVTLDALDGDGPGLTVRDNEALQRCHFGAWVSRVRNRAKSDLHALRPQIDADNPRLRLSKKRMCGLSAIPDTNLS